MDTYCDFTELPTLSCSHCSGKRIDAEAFDKDYQSGLSTDWFTPPETKAESLTKRPAADDEISKSLEEQRPATGRYNKTREVYGGHDGQVDFEDLERKDD